jgi:hypothetical protein
MPIFTPPQRCVVSERQENAMLPECEGKLNRVHIREGSAQSAPCRPNGITPTSLIASQSAPRWLSG